MTTAPTPKPASGLAAAEKVIETALKGKVTVNYLLILGVALAANVVGVILRI